MTITISSQDYWDLLQAANPTLQQTDCSDPLDISWKLPSQLGQGFGQEVLWQDELELTIDD